MFWHFKVDTHVHLAGAFVGRELLQFIKRKIATDKDVPVLERRHPETGEPYLVTLGEVYQDLKSRKVESLNLDQMQTQAEASTFQVVGL